MTNLTQNEKLLLAGHRLRIQRAGLTVTLLTEEAKTFVALVSRGPVVGPEALFNPDPREAMTLEAFQDDVPAELLDLSEGSQIPAQIRGVRVCITGRDNNPASPFVQFEAKKVVE